MIAHAWWGMVLMSSTNAHYSSADQAILRKLAFTSIQHGQSYGRLLRINCDLYPDALLVQRACFVTLELDKHLRGCIGHLSAQQPLIQDVVQNAYAAAFQDPRFAPLSASEFTRITLDISVLSEPQPLPYRDREDLLQQLQPGIDGLILSSADGHRGTFLPSVWKSLPQADTFLDALVCKAGLPAGYWSDDLQIERYHTDLIH